MNFNTAEQGAADAQSDHDEGWLGVANQDADLIVAAGRAAAGGNDEYWKGYKAKLLELGYTSEQKVAV